MITSWLDLVLAALLGGGGLYYLRLGEGRRQRSGQRWYRDFAAFLTALLGGTMVAMGAALFFYSLAFAVVIAQSPNR